MWACVVQKEFPAPSAPNIFSPVGKGGGSIPSPQPPAPHPLLRSNACLPPPLPLPPPSPRTPGLGQV